jgi:hypothetical protein
MLFIFDENFPHEFVRGFAIIEKANKKSPISVDVVFSVDFMGGPKTDPTTGEKIGITDEEIIIAASLKEAVIITHDSDFKRIKHYKPLLVQHKVGYIYFRTPKNYVYWDYVKAFVNKWEDIKLEISDSTHPFAFEISKLGHLQKLDF